MIKLISELATHSKLVHIFIPFFSHGFYTIACILLMNSLWTLNYLTSESPLKLSCIYFPCALISRDKALLWIHYFYLPTGEHPSSVQRTGAMWTVCLYWWNTRQIQMHTTARWEYSCLIFTSVCYVHLEGAHWVMCFYNEDLYAINLNLNDYFKLYLVYNDYETSYTT